MKPYTVILPIEVGGKIHQHGSVVELDEPTAALYMHALRPVAQAATADATANPVKPAAPAQEIK